MRRTSLLPLAALLGLVTACGPNEGSGLAVREGERLNDAPECFGLGCPVDQLCVELFFDYGRSPPLCVEPTICDRMTCAEGRCALFDGLPAQLKCIED